jgi:hypothetical protein
MPIKLGCGLYITGCIFACGTMRAQNAPKIETVLTLLQEKNGQMENITEARSALMGTSFVSLGDHLDFVDGLAVVSEAGREVVLQSIPIQHSTANRI